MRYFAVRFILFISDYFQMNTLNFLAYIDPGSGSMVIQIIIATALGGIVAIKMFWQNILRFIKKIFHIKNKKG